MLKSILELSPQQTFLVRGGSDIFATLVEKAEESHFPLVITKAPQLTIDEAVNIAEFATNAGYEPTVGIFYFASYSNGAAEVLLKALEEPHANATVIIVTPYPYTFPATIRSRMRLFEPEKNIDISTTTLLELKKVGAAIAESKDDAPLRRELTLEFLDTLETFSNKQKNSELSYTLAKTIYEAKEFLLKANMPPKQVIEYVLSGGL